MLFCSNYAKNYASTTRQGLAADKRSSFGMEVALDQLFTFHNKNQVLIKELLPWQQPFSQHVRNFGNFEKLQQILLELVENMCS